MLNVSPAGILDCARIARSSKSGLPASIRGRTGFTLVEVMISSVILGLVLGSTLIIISRSSKYLADLRVRARSSQVLQQRIEELRAMSWTQITNLPATFTSAIDTDKTYKKTLMLSDYQSANGTAVVVRVTAQVVWTNQRSAVMTNTLTTLISNGGLNKTSL